MKTTLKLLILLLLAALSLVIFLNYHSDKPLSELKEKYAQPPSAFMALEDMEVHYRDEGLPGDSIPLVLIHGTAASLHTFDAWAAALKGEKRIIRMDIPAFGLTGPFPDKDYSIAHYVVFLHDFLQKLGVQKFILGGNSLGGQIAWQYTLKYPEEVQKLILIDAAGYPLQSQSVPLGFRLARVPVLNKLLTKITPRSLVHTSVENVYADKSKVNEALVDRYFDLLLRPGNRQAIALRMNSAYDTTALSQIKNIKQATLVLWGEQDHLIPLHSAYRFHKDLSNDTLVILKNSGHVPMDESPEESLQVLREFLK